MITEQDLLEYNTWLMEVWNPNQLHIPFAQDAPKAFLKHKGQTEKSNFPSWLDQDTISTIKELWNMPNVDNSNSRVKAIKLVQQKAQNYGSVITSLMAADIVMVIIHGK